MPLRSLVFLLAAGLGLAAQPAPSKAPAAATQGGTGKPVEPEERKEDVRALQSGTYLLLKSEPLTLVLERGRYSLLDSTLRILVGRRESGRVVLSDGCGRWEMAREDGDDEAAYWKSILASGKWALFRQGLDPRDLDDLKAQAEALVAEGAGKEPPPAWLGAARQVQADLGRMAAGAEGRAETIPVLAVGTSRIQKERKESGIVLHVESHNRGFVSLRLSVDGTGMAVAQAELAFGRADYHLKRTREGKAFRTRLSFSTGGGTEAGYEGVGPWALVPEKVYPRLLQQAAARPFAAVDLESARALVAQLLADGTRAPMLRNPLLKCVQADLDALATLVASAPARVEGGTGAAQELRLLTFSAGDLTLGIDRSGYTLLDSRKDFHLERAGSGRLSLSGPLGHWTFTKKTREESEASFWKRVLEGPGGATLRKVLAPKEVSALHAQVGDWLYDQLRRGPLPDGMTVAGMAWSDLEFMAPRAAETQAPAQPPACARALFQEERKEAALPVAVKVEPTDVPVLALPSPVAVPALEEKAPAEAEPWRAESSKGDRIVIRPAGYDLHLGGLRLAFLRGGSGPDSWVTYSVIDREGHIHGKGRSFRARDPRPASGDALLGALAEQHYDEFELSPLVEAWLDDGAHRMNRHLDRASLEELEGAMQDRLDALAAVDPRPADLAATFLAYMELFRFNTHLRAIDKETVD